VLAGTATLACLIIALCRSRWPAWFRTLLMMVAWVGLAGSAPTLIHKCCGPITLPIERRFGAAACEVSYTLIQDLPLALIYAVPVVAALLDLSRRGSRSWTRLERVAAVAAFLAFLATTAMKIIIAWTSWPRWQFEVLVPVHALVLLLALGLGILVVRALTLRWKRWLGTSYVGDRIDS
jgi:hypothetical protein